MRFKVDWASLIVRRKCTIFALFYLVYKGNFQVPGYGGAHIRRGDLTEGFLRYRFRGLIFGGDYTWRGLFSDLYGIKSPSRGSCLKTGLIERIEDLSESLVYYIAWKRRLSKVFLYAYAKGVFVV